MMNENDDKNEDSTDKNITAMATEITEWTHSSGDNNVDNNDYKDNNN